MRSLVDKFRQLTLMMQLAIIASGAVAIALLIVGWHLAVTPKYGLLFGGLKQQDATAISRELDRENVDYRLSDSGADILVAGQDIAKLRMKVMASSIQFSQPAGLELFDKADVSMNEFQQRVTYQRALQGELERTISSLSGVEGVRVHLTLQERSIFKRNANGKAAVTLTLAEGASIDRKSVEGIQQLVAYSAPDVEKSGVTVVDQRGVVLSRNVGEVSQLDQGDEQLGLKRNVEAYFTTKIAGLLDSALGTGNYVLGVDVRLSADASTTVTEEVLGADSGVAGSPPTGFVSRERKSWRESNREESPGALDSTVIRRQGGAPNSAETDYQLGKRTESLRQTPGAIRQISVAVGVRGDTDKFRSQRLKELIQGVVGFSEDRGDTVVVHPIDRAAPAVASAAKPGGGNLETLPTQNTNKGEDVRDSREVVKVGDKPGENFPGSREEPSSQAPWVLGYVVAFLVLAGLILAAVGRQFAANRRASQEALIRTRLAMWASERRNELG